jgi:demethylmenaquinone methyltransferase/2-methoxy-6-polyprenyl-1,4-benzoquinol methylase
MLASARVTNKYYAPGEQRAERVNELFDSIAPRYDLVNDLQSLGLHRHWKGRLVKLADAKPGDRVLDVCCGTGDISLAFARAGLKVVGLDFSEGMLAVARQRLVAGRAAAGEAQFLKGDALHLPFPDGSFEVVTMGYGLRNLADWEAGLREMLRVLRPGGRLLVLDFGKPDNRLWRAIYFAYLKYVCPLLGRFACGDRDSYAYILESLKHYAAQRGVAARMTELQLTGVRIVNFLGGATSINMGVKPSPASTGESRCQPGIASAKISPP